MRFSNLWIMGEEDHRITIECGDKKILRISHHIGNDKAPFEGFVTPGFIDTHIHGAAGFDTSDADPEGLCKMAVSLAKVGTAAFCPTTMTIPEDQIFRVCESVAKASEILKNTEEPHAKIIGLHLEGPFLNPLKCGVQNDSCCVLPKDGMDLVERIEKEFPGLLKMIDIAPELEGSIEFIKTFKDRYVISLGHTAADHDIAMEAFNSGASGVTHALNAMDPILKRSTGVLGAAIDSGAYVEVISDLHHIDRAMVRLLYSDVFEERTVTVSDSMRGALMPDGVYDLGGTDVTVRNGRTYYGEEGGLAGSVSFLCDEFVKLIDIGVNPIRAVDSVTDNPLMRLGIMEDETMPGVLDIGRPATFNVFDKNGRLLRVINEGNEL